MPMKVWLDGTEAFVKSLYRFDVLYSGDDLLKTNWKYIRTGNTNVLHIFFRMNNPSIWVSV